MLIEKTRFEKILSLLQGASLALAMAGSGYTFFAFLPFGIVPAFIIGLFFFLLGSFFFIMFEIAQQQIDKMDELKKQTYLLEKLSQNEQKLSYH